MKMKKSSLFLGILVIFTLLILPQDVYAHSHVTESSPKDGEEVDNITEIILTFNAGIEQVSTVSVYDDSGTEINVQEIVVNSPVLTASFNQPLEPGVYDVHWNALGEDTHQTEGSFSFTVNDQEPTVDELVESDQTEEQTGEPVNEDEQENSVGEGQTEDAQEKQSPVRLFAPFLIASFVAAIIILALYVKGNRK